MSLPLPDGVDPSTFSVVRSGPTKTQFESAWVTRRRGLEAAKADRRASRRYYQNRWVPVNFPPVRRTGGCGHPLWQRVGWHGHAEGTVNILSGLGRGHVFAARRVVAGLMPTPRAFVPPTHPLERGHGTPRRYSVEQQTRPRHQRWPHPDRLADRGSRTYGPEGRRSADAPLRSETDT